MASPQKAPLRDTLWVRLPEVSPSDSSSAVIRAPFAGFVSRFSYVLMLSVLGADGDTRSLQLINHGKNGLGSAVIAVTSFGSDVIVQSFKEESVTIPPEAAQVSEGDIIEVRSEPIGEGFGWLGGASFIEFERW